MNLPPDSTAAARARIMERHRGNVLQRARALEAEWKLMESQLRDAQRQVKLYGARLTALIDELRQADETTVRLPRLPG